jgi:phosphoheptose isomerase
VDNFLENLQFFKEENDPEVLNLIISCLSSIERLVDNNQTINFQKYCKDFFSHALEKIGIENKQSDTNKVKEFKASLIRGLGNLCSDIESINYCNELFDTYRKSPENVEANALAATISVLSNNGDTNLYNEFLNLYLNSSTPQEEMRFLFALCSFQNADNFINTLELSLSDKVRTQNAPYLLGQTLRNKKHFSVSWGFIENNWDKINDKFPENSIPRLLTGIRAITDDECSEKIKTFLNNNKVPQGQKTVDQHLEKLNINLKFAHFNLKYLEKTLEN